jgi:hypothetical protein
VQREHAAAQALVLQREAQHPGAGDRPAVVGEPDRAVLAQLGHLGQLGAVQPACDRGHEADRDPRVAQGGVAQRLQHGRRVDDRVGVRHAHDQAEPAGRGGARPGLEVLLVLLAGRTQVDVRVDERGEQVTSGALDGLGALGRLERSGCADLGDLAAANDHVGGTVEAGARVQDVRRAHEQVGGLRRRGDDELAHASDGSGAGSSARAPASTS